MKMMKCRKSQGNLTLVKKSVEQWLALYSHTLDQPGLKVKMKISIIIITIITIIWWVHTSVRKLGLNYYYYYQVNLTYTKSVNDILCRTSALLCHCGNATTSKEPKCTSKTVWFVLYCTGVRT